MNRILVIARHEIKLRFFSKAIAFNLLILLAIVSVTPWIPKLIDSNKAISIGIYMQERIDKESYTKLQRSIISAGKSQAIDLSFVLGDSLNQLKSESKAQNLSLAIGVTGDNFNIAQFDTSQPQVLAFLNIYSRAIASNEYLSAKGLSIADFESYIATYSAKTDLYLKQAKELTSEQYFTSMILNLLLFTLIVLASTHLVMGVVEEKSSHVMEIILYAVRPRQLLMGKLVGISTFIFLQFLLLIGVGYTSASFAGAIEKAHLSLASAATVLLWFPPAFLFFAILYAALGARTSRTEEIGAVQAPLMFLTTASLYASVFSVNTPNAQWVQIMTYIPPFSFFMESGRTLLATSTASEQIISWLIAVAATVLVAVLGIKTFEKRVFATK